MQKAAAGFPEWAGRPARILGSGFDSVALEVDGLVFKFPQHESAHAALVREASLLAVIRPAVTLPVPDLELVHSPLLFLRHHKIPGEHLFSGDFFRMNEAGRAELARALAQFLAETHALDPAMMKIARATPIKPWLKPEEILTGLETLLSGPLRDWALRTFDAWQSLPADPYGMTYGHFDGHGWNMAFDHAVGKLNGIYDFADSGFGPLHQDFIYSSWISLDLTGRIIDVYENITHRSIDRSRVRLLFFALLLSELVESAREQSLDVGKVVQLTSLAEAFPSR